MQECVYVVQIAIRNTSHCEQLKAAPHWHFCKHMTKRHRRSSWSMEKAIMCKNNAKGHHFEYLLNENLLFSEPTHYTTGSFRAPTVYRENMLFASFPSQLFKSKWSKKQWRYKVVKYAYHFWMTADDVDWKLSKLIHACRSYSLPKLAHILDTVYVFQHTPDAAIAYRRGPPATK